MDDDDDGWVCLSTSYMQEPMPFDVVFVVDRSEAMTQQIEGHDTTRWEGVVEAISDFVTHPGVIARDVRVALQFYSATGGLDQDVDCDITSYSQLGELGVDFASVTDSDQAQTLVDTLASVVPRGTAPTRAALQGAMLYAKGFRVTRGLGRGMAVVLITDGASTGCQDPVGATDLAAFAQEEREMDPSVFTFVVGVGGERCDLHRIASAGGAPEAYFIEDGEVVDALLDGLVRATRPVPPCELPIAGPPSELELVDLAQVRVRVAPDLEVVELVPQLGSSGECSDSEYGGWHFDDRDAPTQVVLCPCTCEGAGIGFLEVQYGCTPMTP